MSEGGDKKMKGVSSVKNDAKRKNLSLQDQPNTSTCTQQSNLNLQLSIGGVYAQSPSSPLTSQRQNTPAVEDQPDQRKENPVSLVGSRSVEKADRARNTILAHGREAYLALQPTQTSASKLIAQAVSSASRIPALYRAIHQIRRDSLALKRKGHEVLPPTICTQPMPILPSRMVDPSNAQAACTRLQYLMAPGVAVGQRHYHYSTAAYAEFEFQNKLDSSSHSNRRAVPGIQLPNPAFSSSYAKPAAGSINLPGPLDLNSNGNIPVHDFAETSPVFRSKGKSVDFGLQNLPGFISSNEKPNAEFKKGPGSISNENSSEFAATNHQNLSGSGSNGLPFEPAAILVKNSPSGSIDMIQNPPSASGTSENPIDVDDMEAKNEQETGSNKEAEGGSSSNAKPDEPDEIAEFQNPAKRVKLNNEGIGENDMNVMKKMPGVVATREDGRQVHGIMYKYQTGEAVSIVCNCHGYFLDPAQFLKHAGFTDLSNPLEKIWCYPISDIRY